MQFFIPKWINSADCNEWDTLAQIVITIMTVSTLSDPFEIIHSLASTTSTSIPSSSRLEQLFTSITSQILSSTTDNNKIENDDRCMNTPAIDTANFLRARIWIQKDCIETEYFIPFNKQNEFVMFSNEDQQEEEDCIGEQQMIPDNQHSFDLLVPRYKYRICIVHSNQYKDAPMQSVAQSNSIVNAYCYFDYKWKLCSVHDIIGVIDKSGDIHVLSSTPYSYKSELVEGITHLDQFEECVNLIKDVVGERDAAIFILLCLISKPVLRQEGLVDSLLIGTLPLNLILPEDADTNELISFIQSLKKDTKNIVMSLNTLKQSTWIPSVAEEQTGATLDIPMLQAPTNTLLILNETQLEEGKLDKISMTNIQHIQDLITHQRLAVHGVYADINFADEECNASERKETNNMNLLDNFSLPISNGIMVISKGKSILSGLTPIKLNNLSSLSEEELKVTTSHTNYLKCAQSLVGKVEFPKELTDEISQCYIDARAKNHSTTDDHSITGKQSKKIDENTLANALNLTRLLSGAKIKTTAGREEWEEGWRLAQLMQ